MEEVFRLELRVLAELHDWMGGSNSAFTNACAAAEATTQPTIERLKRIRDRIRAAEPWPSQRSIVFERKFSLLLVPTSLVPAVVKLFPEFCDEVAAALERRESLT